MVNKSLTALILPAFLSPYREQNLIRNLSWLEFAVTDLCCKILCYHTAGDKPHAHKNQSAVVKDTVTVSASYRPIIRLPCSFADVCWNPYSLFFLGGGGGRYFRLSWYIMPFSFIILSFSYTDSSSALFYFSCPVAHHFSVLALFFFSFSFFFWGGVGGPPTVYWNLLTRANFC